MYIERPPCQGPICTCIEKVKKKNTLLRFCRPPPQDILLEQRISFSIIPSLPPSAPPYRKRMHAQPPRPSRNTFIFPLVPPPTLEPHEKRQNVRVYPTSTLISIFQETPKILGDSRHNIPDLWKKNGHHLGHPPPKG